MTETFTLSSFMTVTEALQFVDQLVFKQTGNHLSDLQKKIVQGILQNQTYGEIAKEFGYDSENHIGSVSRELYKILSEIVGEDINKNNFCWTIERLINHSQLVNNFSNNNINVCSNNKTSTQDINKNKDSVKYSHHDLTFAPQILTFYDHISELETLNSYIFNQNIKLISVLGLSGIGKSYLVRKFIDLNLDKFEVIIWRSLKYPQSLDLLINDFLNLCEQEPKETIQAKLTQFFDLITKKKCLIILDDVQNIFISGELAGKYRPEYQDYQNFFTMIAESEQQSNVIVISQEQCPEIICLDEDLHPINCLQLSGLDNTDILKNSGLKDSLTSITNHEEHWLKLINLYEGNPFYLKTVVNSIKNIFDGNVGEFLEENELIITKDMQSNLQLLFNRLSLTEQQIVFKLSKFDQPVSREELKTSLELSSTDFINGLHSLQQRYIVTKIKADKILFKLDSVFRGYVRNCFKD